MAFFELAATAAMAGLIATGFWFCAPVRLCRMMVFMIAVRAVHMGLGWLLFGAIHRGVSIKDNQLSSVSAGACIRSS